MSNLDVFFDIDGCLINSSYDFTVSPQELSATVKKYENIMRVHINSNRSLPSILNIWNKVGFAGLIVYENGQGVFDPVTNTDLNSSEKRISKRELASKLLSISDEVKFISTDKLIQNPADFSSQKSKSIFCEESRDYTATVYPRINLLGVPVIDWEFLNITEKLLEEHYGRDYEVCSSKIYCNVMLTPNHALKSNPMQKIAGNNLIASFGDENPDIKMFEESTPGLIGCPANASKKVQEFVSKKGGLVSKKEYTAGALDFLNYISKKISRESL
ncbi:MAG: HAD hydrolase family protein [archaeon]